jgi:hypothetical protein
MLRWCWQRGASSARWFNFWHAGVAQHGLDARSGGAAEAFLSSFELSSAKKIEKKPLKRLQIQNLCPFYDTTI